jgi:hypothetical protein
MKDSINSPSQREIPQAESAICNPCIVSDFVPVPMAENKARKQETMDAINAYKEGKSILKVMPISGHRA